MIRMTRDSRDVWPEDVPRGTFDIECNGLVGRPAVTAHIFYVCPNGRRCGVFLGPQFEARPSKDQPNVWAWDGNLDAPTITPSIDCRALTEEGKPAGCGWHGFIRAGMMTTA